MKDLDLPKERFIVANAAVWKRVIAFLLDVALLSFIVFAPLEAVIQGAIPTEGFAATYQFLADNPGLESRLYLTGIAVFILTFLYFTVLEWKIQQSVGKILLGIHVVKESASLTAAPEAPTLWQCVLRSIVLIPFLPFVILWLIDPLMMILTQKNQRLSELLSRTRVVEYVKA